MYCTRPGVLNFTWKAYCIGFSALDVHPRGVLDSLYWACCTTLAVVDTLHQLPLLGMLRQTSIIRCMISDSLYRASCARPIALDEMHGG